MKFEGYTINSYQSSIKYSTSASLKQIILYISEEGDKTQDWVVDTLQKSIEHRTNNILPIVTNVKETKIEYEQNKEEGKICLTSRLQKLQSSSPLSSSPSLAQRLLKLKNESIIAPPLSTLQDRLQALGGHTIMNNSSMDLKKSEKTRTNEQEVDALVSQAYEEVCLNGSDHFHILSDSESHSQSDLNSCYDLSDADQSSSCSE